MHDSTTNPGNCGAAKAAYSPLGRAAMMLITAAFFLPIILGAITENEQIRRESFRRMREEHMRRVAAERFRFAERHRIQHEIEREPAPYAGDSPRRPALGLPPAPYLPPTR
jgi:hypothetical protein